MAVYRLKPLVPFIGADFSQYMNFLITGISTFNHLSPTSMTGGSPPVLAVRLNGTGLEYQLSAPLPRPVDGTLTGGFVEYFGKRIMTISQMALSADGFGDALAVGAPEAIAFLLSKNDQIFGTIVGDTLAGGKGNDAIYGGDGADSLSGFLGLPGGDGRDSLFGGLGTDIIAGGSGNDELFGGVGVDNIIGGDGNDLVRGGDGGDVIQGELGADRLFGDDAGDQVFGGAGNDRLFGGGGLDAMSGGLDNDALNGGADEDTIQGDAGADRIDGGSGADSVHGNEQNDMITGGRGNDTLLGGTENDLLRGEAGADLLFGGLGADRFVFDTALSFTNVDVIDDFTPGDDLILFDNDVFTALGAAGALAASRFRAGTAATDASDRIIYDGATGELFYDRDGQGGTAQVRVAWLDPALALDAGDFRVIG